MKTACCDREYVPRIWIQRSQQWILSWLCFCTESLPLTGRGETIINGADWEAIFRGFDDVYRFQHRLLQELEAEWISQLAAAAPDKLKPPEGVCYKQRPTMRTWPARYVRIEGKAFNV